MATGLLVNSACYETSQDAINAYFSGLPVATFQDAVNPALHHLVKFEQVGGAWMRSQYDSTPQGDTLVASVAAVPPAFPACLAPSEMYVSGLEFGAAVCSLLVIPFAFRAARKVL